MRFRVVNRFRARPTVATVVETAVAMATTMVVTVFFVAIVVFPQTAFGA